MIITTYGKDGRKERHALGYKGGACQRATLPYERREVTGTMQKTLTGEACLPEDITQAQNTDERIGVQQ